MSETIITYNKPEGKPINLYVDMDNTSFDFTDQYLIYHFRNTSQRVGRDIIDNAGYHFFERLGISDKDKYKYLTQDGFFSTMNPMNGMVDIINYIHYNTIYKVVFVTHAVVLEAFHEKALSLQKHFDWFNFEENLILMKNKHLLQAGVIIDDNPTVLENSYGHHITIAYDDHWNKQSNADYRINKWDSHLLDVLNSIIS